MEHLEELQGRIKAALDRIGSGVGALDEHYASRPLEGEDVAAESDTGANAALLEALEDEKTANAQLEARNTQLHNRIAEMEKKVAAADKVEDVLALEAELELLRNEANSTAASSVAFEALNSEVSRLKGELEVTRNEAASEKENFELELETLTTRLDTLQAEADKAPSEALVEPTPETDPESDVDTAAAVEAATASLKQEVEALTVQLEKSQADAQVFAQSAVDSQEAEVAAKAKAEAAEKTLAAAQQEVAEATQALSDAQAQAASTAQALAELQSTSQSEIEEAQDAALAAQAAATQAQDAALEAQNAATQAEERATQAEEAQALVPEDAPDESMTVADLETRLHELDASLNGLRNTNDDLTKANAALRQAISEGLGDAGLINQGLEAELAAANAAREADQAEVNAILARLEMLLPEAPVLQTAPSEGDA